jgi:hypothetical protein
MQRHYSRLVRGELAMPGSTSVQIHLKLGRLTPLLLVALALALVVSFGDAQASRRPIQPTFNAMQTGSYYLTSGSYTGDLADEACTAGYHMATLWEILDTSNLVYDTSLGYQHTPGDGGAGPPTAVWGWVRTGAVGSIGTTPGSGNCAVWTYGLEDTYGTVISLPNNWITPGSTMGPWVSGIRECNQPQRVWCHRSGALLVLPAIFR